MSALNSNDTFDGLDEPVRPTLGGRKRRLDKENHKKKKKKKVLRWCVNTHINTVLIWDVNVTDVYTSKGGV